MPSEIEFDEYAAGYDATLDRGLSVTGEDKDYFARGRIKWLARCLRKLGAHPQSVLDFGCGTGSATSYLAEFLDVESVIGLDVSPKSIDAANRGSHSDGVRFMPIKEYHPASQIDLAFCNGVFHHI